MPYTPPMSMSDWRSNMLTATKAKVTLTLDPDLVAAVDECARNGTPRSRSATVEEILRQWRHQEAVRQYEREVEEYCTSMTDEERADYEDWAMSASKAAALVWGDYER
ncbi:MAG: hypothetical protein COY42_17055 [Armatimonadetes bacterium CG_4_10_14_0_8_um_filter_66_14]|nr:MAG: hypothetical protein COY42_17055 [Armatimonadetes bacterium CG_4_10_14_0_8_um_filter_66_14]